MPQGNYADNMATDASSVANTAKQGIKDAKTAVNVAKNLATGNVAGAAVEAVKNPNFLKNVIITAIIVFMMLLSIIVAPIVLALALPINIFTGIADAVSHVGEDIKTQWLISEASFSNAANDFWNVVLGTGGGSELFISDTAGYFDDKDSDIYWGESNLQISVLNNYFKSSYTNACKRANNSIDANVDQEALKDEAEAAGIERDYVKFNTVEVSADSTANFQRVAFYIMAMDSYKNTLSNDGSNSETNVEKLTRMVDMAKKITPNGFIDAFETAFNIEDEHMWVTNYSTSFSDAEEVVGYEHKTHQEDDPDNPGQKITVEDKDENGNPIDDTSKPITKMVRTYTTTVTVQLNADIRNKMYEMYGIDTAETYSDHSTVFHEDATSSASITPTSGVKTTPADIIEQEVDQMMSIYQIPDINGTTGGAGIYGSGVGTTTNTLTDEEIAALVAQLGDETKNLSENEKKVVALAQAILSSPNPELVARQAGITHFTGGVCQGFVTDLLQAAGVYSGSRPLSALDGWRNYVSDKHDISEPPTPGSLLYFNSSISPEYGHVALYVGGGMTLEVWTDGIVISTFENTISQSWSSYIGWGHMY